MIQMKTQVHRITRNGFSTKHGNGGVPAYMKELMPAFKYRVPQGRTRLQKAKALNGRCTRPGFVPFHANTGSLTKNAIKDGVPRPSEKKPLYLITVTNTDGKKARLKGTAVLFREGKSVVLEYLCGAQGTRGIGKQLLARALQRGTYSDKGLKTLQLHNNSGLPNYYIKQGFEPMPSLSLGAISRFYNSRRSMSISPPDRLKTSRRVTGYQKSLEGYSLRRR
jgi:hypothetical protein